MTSFGGRGWRRGARNLATGAVRCLLWGLYGASYLSIRSDRTCVFGGGFDAFSNGKHLALHLAREHPGIRVSWITHHRAAVQRIREGGLDAHYKWSIRGILWTLRARWVFVNSYSFDVNYWLTGGAVRINLWHGVPLKKLGFDITTGPLARVFQARGLRRLSYRLLSSAYRRPDAMISTSPETQALFARAFRLAPEDCPPLGYPRTDLFFWEEHDLRVFIEKFEPDPSRAILQRASGASTVWAYVPTWRDGRRQFLSESGIDWGRVDEVCGLTSSILILKVHPLTSIDDEVVAGLSNVILAPKTLDLYPLLYFVDALITDYSSIYFDFLLLDRPMLFFPFDMAEYVADSREMYFDYEAVTPGEKARTPDDLYRHLASGPPVGWTRERAELRARIWGHQDGRSAERIVEFMSDLRPGSGSWPTRL